MSRLAKVADLGQQIWLDNLSRSLITSGRLARWIEEDQIAGVTSNPAIFFNAIQQDEAYQVALAEVKQLFRDPEQRFEALVLPDIQSAADLLKPLYDATAGEKGYVSFEVSPALSHDAEGTIAAAKRLWKAIDRPNVMIKIPATPAGIQALAVCIAEGINVNVTLMFSPAHVADVFDAYIRGLTQRRDAGLPVQCVRSVASIFISRVDTMVDKLLPVSASHLQGQIAIAAAKAAYQYWLECFGSEQFKSLLSEGAMAQTLLWASTGTKNAAYRDVRYVEELIGAETINTVPDATLLAFADHGEARYSIDQYWELVQSQLAELSRLNIYLDDIGEQLQQEGLKQFEDAFAKLILLVSD